MAVKKQSTKRTLKYLSILKNPLAIRATILRSPDPVIKGICNVALNVFKGDVKLSKGQKKKFAAVKPYIIKLIDPNLSIKQKRGIIQRGSGPFLAALPALIGAVGSLLPSIIGSFKQ